nr:AraC family ligand binding domain-containing protein [Aeromonas salmonicida]
MSRTRAEADHHSFWRDPALPFIEARAVQDGRRVCYEKHSHAHFSIGAITGGHSHYLNQHTKQEVNAGTLVLMNPEEVHACNPIADHPWSYLMFYLDTDWLRGQQEEAGLGAHFRPFDMTASRDPVLYAGLLRLYRTLQDDQQDRLAKEVVCHQFSHQLLERLTPARWSEPPPLHLRRAAELIKDEYATPPHLAAPEHSRRADPIPLGASIQPPLRHDPARLPAQPADTPGTNLARSGTAPG